MQGPLGALNAGASGSSGRPPGFPGFALLCFSVVRAALRCACAVQLHVAIARSIRAKGHFF
eukprot:7998462-Pyramimonas_sp.AAC.1